MPRDFCRITLILIGLFWLTGCGRKAAEPKPQPTIVWVNPLVGHPIYRIQDEAFKEAARDYGFKPVIVGPSTIADPEGMVREIENAIVQKVDGIITVPFNWSAFEDVYKRARKTGVSIINTGVDTPEQWRLGFIGTDNQAFGRQAAQLLAKKTGGKANICIMMSQLDVLNQIESRQAFEEAIRPYPNMKVVIVEADKADMAVAVQKFEEVFRAYPQINTVLMLEATGGAAAARVAREMGILPRVTILAVDDIQETIDCVRDGSIWGTLAQNFLRMGYESAGMIMDHLEGRPVASKTDSGLILVTRENVDAYHEMMKKAIRRRPARRESPQKEKP